MNIGIFFCLIGVVADFTTTIIGVGMGLQELNPVGVKLIFLFNFALLFVLLYADYMIAKKYEFKKTRAVATIVLLCGGLFRMYIAYSNYRTILAVR